MLVTRLYEITSDACNYEFQKTITFFTGEISKKDLEDWLISKNLYVAYSHKDYDCEARSFELNNIFSDNSTLYGIEVCEVGEVY